MTSAVIFDLYETLITEFGPDRPPKPSPAARVDLDPAAFDAAWQSRRPGRVRGAGLTPHQAIWFPGRWPASPQLRQATCPRLLAPADVLTVSATGRASVAPSR